jgi:hypothetical protein
VFRHRNSIQEMKFMIFVEYEKKYRQEFKPAGGILAKINNC